jgi:hypothetical protein
LHTAADGCIVPALCMALTVGCRPLNATDGDSGVIGGFTPADYMTWSDDPTRQCHHHVEVLVDAPLDVCFGIWLDWKKLINFLDLVQQARPPLGAHIATVTAVAAVLHILTLCPALLRYCRSGWTTIPQTWLYSSASIVGVSVALLRLCLPPRPNPLRACHSTAACWAGSRHSAMRRWSVSG